VSLFTPPLLLLLPLPPQVTNTGSVDSDDVVLGFLVPPGAGTDGIPLQVRVWVRLEASYIVVSCRCARGCG
jgi:hypothetical protein